MNSDDWLFLFNFYCSVVSILKINYHSHFSVNILQLIIDTAFDFTELHLQEGESHNAVHLRKAGVIQVIPAFVHRVFTTGSWDQVTNSCKRGPRLHRPGMASVFQLGSEQF